MAHIHNPSSQSSHSDSFHIDDPLAHGYQSDSVRDSDNDSDTPSIDLGPRPQTSLRTIARRNNHPIRYAFSQLFGELSNDPTFSVTEADMISAVRFNSTSDMIAAGDKGGRIILLKRLPSAAQRRRAQQQRRTRSRTRWPSAGGPSPTYQYQQPLFDQNYHHDFSEDSDDSDAAPERPLFDFWAQFQSHDRELDYLRNLDIEEKINQICWCRPVSGAQRLLVSNEKTIKLWRVYEKDVKRLVSMDPSNVPSRDGTPLRHSPSPSRTSPIPRPQQSPQSPASDPQQTRRFPLDTSSLKFPRLESQGQMISAVPKRIYRSAHFYHINSISLNSDEETFLSADDLRINIWNLHRNGTGINIMDIKPNTMTDLSEVITGAEFHPHHCSLFAYTNTQAVVKLCDLRTSAMCRSWVRRFEETEPNANQSSFFAEIISSLSDLKFSPDGQFIMTRDYMNLRLWDVRMERAPVLLIPVHEHLRSRLCDLYQNDCIFDKFQCCFSGDGGSLLTGSYNALFQTYSAHDGSCSALETSIETVTGLSGRQHYSAEGLAASLQANSSVPELVDPTKRVMCLDASPQDQIAAVAAGPAIYFYNGINR